MKHHLCLAELKLFAILFVFVISLCGCSSTYPVRYTTNVQLNEELAGWRGTIELQDGKEVFAKEVKIYNDSASWLDVGTNGKSKVSMEKVKRIVIVKKDHVLGALEWLFLGGLGGAGVGWLSASSEPRGYSKEYGAPVVFGYGMIGAGIGLVAGAIIGHRENYEYQLTEGDDSGKKTHIEKSSTKADVLYLKNDDIVRGTIITEVGDEVYLRYAIIRSADGKTLTYYGADIERIERGE